MSLVKKVIKKLKSGTWYPFYNTFYEKVKVNPREILLVSRSGIALESNILAICRELSRPEYRKFRKVLAIQKEQRQNIQQKLDKYHISVDKIIDIKAPAYYYHLSRAGFLINDTTFPGRYIKKNGQVYLNVWHGTPLKRMGQDNEQERFDMGNVMRNLLMADYLLFPNIYMEKKMTQAYNLKELYQGVVLHEGYPRNCIFFDKEQGVRLKESLGAKGCQLSLYMPTFRGKANSVETDAYISETKGYLEKLDQLLKDDQLLIVKLHPFVQKYLDSESISYKHIRNFPKEYDTYDVLNACDVLITDYSSVMYDFANTGRKIILFAYDIEKYNNQRGMYEDITSYPFDLAATPEEVINFLRTDSGTPDRAFLEKYNTFEHHDATARICRHILLGEKCCMTSRMPGCSKKKVLIYAGSLFLNGITTAFCNLMNNLDREKYQYYVSFRMHSFKDDPGRLGIIPEGVSYYPLATEMNLDVITAAAQMIYLKYGITSFGIGKRLEKAYDREWKKHFPAVSFDHIVHYDGYENYMIGLLGKAPCTKTIWVHNDMEQETRIRKNPSIHLLHKAYRSFDHVIAVSEDIVEPTFRISGRQDNIQVISNYIDYQNVRKRAALPLSYDEYTESTVSEEELKSILSGKGIRFITIGRFSPEKGHERLIRAFNRFWKEHPDSYLIILGGRGDLYQKTLEIAGKQNAKDHIVIIKAMSNPMPVLKSCDCFLLSSFYEGLGLVILEADILHVPAAACNVRGPRTIMQNNGGTLLEDSEDGLLKGMYLFLNGQITPMNIDYDTRNRKILRDCEDLFAK